MNTNFQTALRALLLSALVAAGLLLSGCAEKGNPAAAATPNGVYHLVAVNGTKVPTTIDHEGAKLQVRSGAFTFTPDGACSSKMVFVPPNGQEVTREVKASYTKTGPKLTMRWEGAGTTTGELKGEVFNMENEGMTLSYRAAAK